MTVGLSGPTNQTVLPKVSLIYVKDITFRSTFPHGGQPQPCPRPLMNHSRENIDTVEDQEKTTLMPPTRKRPMEKSQRALILSDSTPLMNLLMAYAIVWLLVIRPAETQ